MNTVSDSHEQYVRRLLDLRAARTQLGGHVPSVVSDYMDTPSMYSNGFSPRPIDKSQLEAEHLSYDPPRGMPVSDAKPPMFNRDLLNKPGTSVIDLEDDVSNPSPPPSHPFGIRAHTDSVEEEEDNVDVDDEPDMRMSLLGPKMRFHSRAPWETGEDTLREVDEFEEPINPNRGRGMFARGFGIPSSGRRSSSAGRRSGDSNGTQPKSKASSEISQSPLTNSPNLSYTVSQPLHSNAIPHTQAQGGMRNPLSSIRERAHTPNYPSPLPSPLLSPNSPMPHSYSPQPLASPFRSNTFSSQPNGGLTRVESGSSAGAHPFSNPELAMSYPTDASVPQPSRPALVVPDVVRSDSNTTVTGSTMAGSSALSAVPSKPQRNPNRHAHLTTRDISSPITVIRSARNDGDTDATLPVPHNIAGWSDQVTTPAFGLISLEEARAQRSRSATVHTVLQSLQPDAFGIGSSSTESDLDSHSTHTVHHGHHDEGVMPLLARARSISAGGKLKSAHVVAAAVPRLQRANSQSSNEGAQGQSVANVPGRQVRHKKSGLMRLFNGKEKDRTRERPVVHSVVMISEPHAVNNVAPVHREVAPPQPRAPPHRVPVPKLSQSSLESSANDLSFNGPFSNEDQEIPLPTTRTIIPPKRTPPPLLSINTSSPARPFFHKSSVDISRSAQNSPISQLMTERPNKSPTHSAPPEIKDFPVLSLRPVSTLFSAHFAEHIVSPTSSSPPQSEESCDPSTSPPDPFTPITPVSSMRSLSRATGSPGPEDQSAVVRALQNQITNTKKAWQRQVWELECQIKELKDELEHLRQSDGEHDRCEQCGRGKGSESPGGDKKPSVMHRPRARTGAGSGRFGSVM